MKQTTQYSSFARLAGYIFILGLLSACGSSRKLNTDNIYFQNGPNSIIAQHTQTIIQINDEISIVVYSQTSNQEQAAIFNIPIAASTLGNTIQGYKVNSDGNIEMPVIGAVRAAGLTKDQLQVLLLQKLTNYVKNPTVLIKFVLFNVYVLGEVHSPGTQKINGDKATIIDAISGAGDLTDYGKREDITVIREEDGKKNYYNIDLRSRSLFQSPVYVLQPNDIVYVGPNKNKLKILSVDPDAQRRTNSVLTVISIFITISTFILSLKL